LFGWFSKGGAPSTTVVGPGGATGSADPRDPEYPDGKRDPFLGEDEAKDEAEMGRAGSALSAALHPVRFGSGSFGDDTAAPDIAAAMRKSDNVTLSDFNRIKVPPPPPMVFPCKPHVT
jgi:hypothetical protein